MKILYSGHRFLASAVASLILSFLTLQSCSRMTAGWCSCMIVSTSFLEFRNPTGPTFWLTTLLVPGQLPATELQSRPSFEKAVRCRSHLDGFSLIGPPSQSPCPLYAPLSLADSPIFFCLSVNALIPCCTFLFFVSFPLPSPAIFSRVSPAILSHSPIGP